MFMEVLNTVCLIDKHITAAIKSGNESELASLLNCKSVLFKILEEERQK